MSTTFKFSDGDFDVDPVTGRFIQISGIEKCAQDIADALMTEFAQRNRSGQALRRNYGSELAGIGNGYTVLFGGFGKPMISRKIQEAVDRLIVSQNADPFVDRNELIDRITNLVVESFGEGSFVYALTAVTVGGQNTTPVTNLREATRLNHQFPINTRTDNLDGY